MKSLILVLLTVASVQAFTLDQVLSGQTAGAGGVITGVDYHDGMGLMPFPTTYGSKGFVIMQSLEGNEGFMSIDPEHTDHETSVIQTEPKSKPEWDDATEPELEESGNFTTTVAHPTIRTSRNDTGGKNKQKRIYQGYKCASNEFDGLQYCLCKPGQKVGRIESRHDNRKEDRKWTLECTDIEPEFIVTSTYNWYTTTTANNWDGNVHWDGRSDNSFLVGMTSEHNNDHEDRKFKFFTAKSALWDLPGCRLTPWQYVNSYDGPMDINPLDDEVIAGLHSVHSNKKEDRVWQALVCKQKSKCGVKGNIVVDVLAAKLSNPRVEFYYFNDIDASKSQTDIKKTLILTQSEINGMSGTKTYSRTSGHTFAVGMSIEKTIGVGIKVFSATGKLTFLANYEYSTSTTFSRSETTTFQEGRQGQSSWETVCKAGFICKSRVKLEKVTATAPYKITAGSCTEEGTIKVENAFTGNIVKEDKFFGEAPPTSCKCCS